MMIRCSLVLALVLAVAQPAAAAKWEGGCPKVKQKLGGVGKGPGGTALAISRYYEHVGHEVTYYLKDNHVVSYGGFSTEPNGNTVQVTFEPIGGDPIPLPAIPVTATTASTLTFTMPDSRDYIGRLVAGPARVTVKRGDTPIFEAWRQVILPPMNDVQGLTQDHYGVDVLATMSESGHLWIPLDFNGYGQGGESLPECPTPLTPVTPFGVEFSLKNDEDEALPYVNFGKLGKNKLFLGDYVVFGLNMYGNVLRGTGLRMTKSPRNEVILCGLNDALQLVVRIPLTEAALSPNSDLLEMQRDGSPLVVRMENVSALPDVAERLVETDYDSVAQRCYPELVP